MASGANDIIKQLSDLSSSGNIESNPSAKKQALELSRQLTASLEEPVDTATRAIYESKPYVSIGTRIAVDLDLFGLIDSHDGPITADQLATKTGAEELLVRRVMRLMTAVGHAKEVGEATYAPNLVSKALTTPGIRAGHKFFSEFMVTSGFKGPRYLKENGYRVPTSPTDGFMQYNFQTKLNIFQLLGSRPEDQSIFDTFMGSAGGSHKHWSEWLPAQEILLDGHTKPDVPLIVDIGGGNGHDLEMFHKRYPGKGRLVVEDLPQVVAGVKDLDPAVERIDYDFFTEQPIKGARAYMYSFIFHNWSDEYCTKILKRVREAMDPGYSKLLLIDMILPDTGASKEEATFDLMMMTFNSALERSRKQWSALLEPAGFEIVKLWRSGEDWLGVVEAVVKV